MKWPGPARPLGGGPLPGRRHGRGHPGRAQQVDLDGGVERRVEADGGGRVHDDVALGQQRQPVVVEAEAVGGHVAGHRATPGRPPRRRSGRRSSARSRSKQSFFRISRVGPLRRRRPAAGADQQDHLGCRERVRSIRSTRAVPRNPVAPVMKKLLAGQGVTDAGHRICLPYGK